MHGKVAVAVAYKMKSEDWTGAEEMYSKYAQRGIKGQRGTEHFQSCKYYRKTEYVYDYAEKLVMAACITNGIQ
jgi:hypothetical protein